jgi:hypothetical protein
MKRWNFHDIRAAIFIAAATHCGMALAAGTTGTTGADLLSDCKKAYTAQPDNPDFLSLGYCLGFIRAVWQMSEKGCGPAGIPMGEIAQIFIKYATDNPEWLHRPAEDVVVAALVKTFPCKPR